MWEIEKQAKNYLSVLEEIASINSMNSKRKPKPKRESDIVTNTSTLKRNRELQEKIGKEGRKEGKPGNTREA